MLHPTSFARQGKLAADYRDTEALRASRDRAASEAGGSVTADNDRPTAPHAAASPIARLRTLLPHAR